MKQLKLKLFVFGLAFIFAGPNVMLEGQRDSTDMAGMMMLAIGGVCLLVAVYLHIRDRWRTRYLNWNEIILLATAIGFLAYWGISQIPPTQIVEMVVNDTENNQWKLTQSYSTTWGITLEKWGWWPGGSGDLGPYRTRIGFTNNTPSKGAEVLTAFRATRMTRPWVLWTAAVIGVTMVFILFAPWVRREEDPPSKPANLSVSKTLRGPN